MEIQDYNNFIQRYGEKLFNILNVNVLMNGKSVHVIQLSPEQQADYLINTNFNFFRSKECKLWRLEHLYFIITKDGQKKLFKANAAQYDFISNYYLAERPYKRILILKSRQLGMTTAISILFLDEIIWNPNTEALQVAHTLKDAGELFNKKISYAVRNLYPCVMDMLEISQNQSKKLQLIYDDADGGKSTSTFSVSNSGRSSTLQLLHISELGKLSKLYLGRAEEIITGTLPALVSGGRCIIESTAEGQANLWYEMYMKALKRKEFITPELSNFEFYPLFYPWMWDKEEIARTIKNTGIIPISSMKECEINWKEYQEENNLTDEELTFYYSKFIAANEDVDKLHQEFPSTCIDGDEKVFDGESFKLMKDIKPNSFVKAHWSNGFKNVYKVTTSAGYTLNCTDNHKIKTPQGFLELKDLKIGDSLELGQLSTTSNPIQEITFNRYPCVTEKIIIDKDMALFLGMFMGDGSFYSLSGTVSMAFTKEDTDLIEIYKGLSKRLFNKEPHIRILGDKKGGAEARFSDINLLFYFQALGILRKKENSSWMRKIHVPQYIFDSPDEIVIEFLKGIFETDGFCSRDGVNIKMFSKYPEFIKDIQLLLLRFGITSKASSIIKKAGNGSDYLGNELCLRKNEGILFKEKIGFLSNRKIERQKLNKVQNYKKPQDILTSDTIKSISLIGSKEVFDMETTTHEFIAGGITVHNCMEAFIGSGSNYFSLRKIAEFYERCDDNYTRYSYINNEFIKDPQGDLYIYTDAKPGKNYVIGADVSEGLENGDYTVACVLGYDKEIKALYRGHIEPDEFANLLKVLGKRYNTAMLAIEFNKDGNWVNTEIRNSNYSNIYVRTVIDDITKEPTKSYGWLTNKKNRDFMLGEAKKHFNSTSMINCRPLLEELMVFVRNKNGKAAAANGKHDDITISWAIAVAVLQGRTEKEEKVKTYGLLDAIFSN